MSKLRRENQLEKRVLREMWRTASPSATTNRRSACLFAGLSFDGCCNLWIVGRVCNLFCVCDLEHTGSSSAFSAKRNFHSVGMALSCRFSIHLVCFDVRMLDGNPRHNTEKIMNEFSNEYLNENPKSDKGESAEKLAFNFCKAATLMLLTIPLGKFALPFVAGAASILFFLAYFRGNKSTRCILQKPLYVGAFWAMVAALSLFFVVN